MIYKILLSAIAIVLTCIAFFHNNDKNFVFIEHLLSQDSQPNPVNDRHPRAGGDDGVGVDHRSWPHGSGLSGLGLPKRFAPTPLTIYKQDMPNNLAALFKRISKQANNIGVCAIRPVSKAAASWMLS